MGFFAFGSLGGPRAVAHPGLAHDIHQVTHAIDEAPDDAALRLERARLYRLYGDFEASLGDLDVAFQIAPQSGEVRLERGLTLAAMGRSDEALAELDRYLSEGGDHPAAYVARGRLHASAGRLDAAIDDVGVAMRQRPAVELYLERGRWLEEQGRLEESAQGYREGIACLNGAVLIRFALIRVESALHRYDSAVALIDEALEGAQVKTEWLLRRAEVLAAAGRAEDSRRDLRRALVESERALARRSTPLNRSLHAKVRAAMGGATIR